ncbi:MAG: diadenosine tetraphosphatase [Verrucomicrobiaceae bacterium]|nr:MAG: diadenosine tetraphosphatase [Verrucomicrobiaceae bacterium]
MKPTVHYDIIGDVHGRHDKLVKLLYRMGYEPNGNGFTPPRGHKAIFLGDLIDPKPGHAIPGGVRATLRTVRSMCDAGHALCLMGNHELNALYFHSKGPDGKWLRHHGSKNVAMHAGTLDEFPDHIDPSGEWRVEWMPWMRQLPLFLDLDRLRAVHATWYPALVERIRGRTLEDDAFFLAAASEKTPEGEAVEVLLRGLTLELPDGVRFQDHAKVLRNRIRARWWEHPGAGTSYDQLIFPVDSAIPAAPVSADLLALVPGYPADAPPVFFGHYLKAADSPFLPERHNVACLDHRGASDGPLVAYRWKGEHQLQSGGYVSHQCEIPC